jgi:hypothetical protein
MMAVEVSPAGPVFRAGAPKMLFEKAGAYDVAPDGRRFLMIKADAATPPAQPNELHVVVNWFEELRRRAPMGGK